MGSIRGVQLVAIMKYFDGKKYKFAVYDKYNYPDELERFDAMVALSKVYQKNGYKILWVKQLALMDHNE